MQREISVSSVESLLVCHERMEEETPVLPDRMTEDEIMAFENRAPVFSYDLEEFKEEAVDEFKISSEDELKDIFVVERNKQLGEGASCRVVPGYDVKGNRHWAVKVYKKDEKGSDYGLHELTRSEIDMLMEVKGGANVVQLEVVIRTPETRMLIFPLYQCSLREVINGEYKELIDLSSAHTVLSCAKMISSGLAYIHSKDIIHRDIKPENIMISDTGAPVIIDFSISFNPKPVRDIPFEKRVMGNDVCTIWYRPLELVMGVVRYGFEIDIFALGCVFYELAAKRPLYGSESNLTPLSHFRHVISTTGPLKAHENSYPHLSKAPLFNEFCRYENSVFHEMRNRHRSKPAFRFYGTLLTSMLAYEPSHRPSALDVSIHLDLRLACLYQNKNE